MASSGEDTAGDVARKLQTLREDVLPQREQFLKSLAEVVTDLLLRADAVKGEIRSAGELALKEVEDYVQKKLLQVDEIEAARRKTLAKQEDTLTSEIGDIKQAIALSDSLLQQSITDEKKHSDMLEIDARVSGESEDADKPKSHARLGFGARSDETLRANTFHTVGIIRNYQACGPHCKAVSIDYKCCLNGRPVSFSFEARDAQNELISHKNVQVRADWKKLPDEAKENPPRLQVTYSTEQTGLYHVTISPEKVGDYELEFVVDDEPFSALWKFRSLPWAFDPERCQDLLEMSDDRLTVKRLIDPSQPEEPETWPPYEPYRYVLGSTVLKTGVHEWKVYVSNPSKEYEDFLIGVIPCEVADRLRDDEDGLSAHAYRWSNAQYRNWADKRKISMITPIFDKDTVTITFDCDQRKMSLDISREGGVEDYQSTYETMDDFPIPEGPYYPYFALHFPDSSFTIVG